MPQVYKSIVKDSNHAHLDSPRDATVNSKELKHREINQETENWRYYEI